MSVLSDRLSRSGENGSSKRGRDETCYVLRSNPRLGEELCVERMRASLRREGLAEREIVVKSLFYTRLGEVVQLKRDRYTRLGEDP